MLPLKQGPGLYDSGAVGMMAPVFASGDQEEALTERTHMLTCSYLYSNAKDAPPKLFIGECLHLVSGNLPPVGSDW